MRISKDECDKEFAEKRLLLSDEKCGNCKYYSLCPFVIRDTSNHQWRRGWCYGRWGKFPFGLASPRKRGIRTISDGAGSGQYRGNLPPEDA